MGTKTPSRVTVSVDVHTPPRHTADGSTAHRQDGDSSNTHAPRPARPGVTPDTVDVDAIHHVPALTVGKIGTTTASIPPHTQTTLTLEQYRINATPTHVPLDANDLRLHKGRHYADLHGGGVTQVAVDVDTGLYRATRSSERIASGPLLRRDPHTRVWHPLTDADTATFPLTEARLQPFRTELDFSGVEPGSDGLWHHDGKRYVVIAKGAYQALQDLEASTPGQPVLRIVKAADPVAADSTNIYHASRAGVSLAVTREAADTWVGVAVGLQGGMRRSAQARLTKDMLLERYHPISEAFQVMSQSHATYEQLWSNARELPDASDEKTRALIGLEVHLLKHIKLEADFVQSCVDNREWLIHLKTSGLYRQELHTFRKERVQSLNRLMVVMDLRVRPTIAALTFDSFRRSLTHLNKKLKLLDERQTVIDQILKDSRDSADEIIELNKTVPGHDQVNGNRLTLYLRLLSDNPEHPPEVGTQSLHAIKLLTADIDSIPEAEHPFALIYALDCLKEDKLHIASLATSSSPEKAGYIREILALIEPFEQRIESRLNQQYESWGGDTELPGLDQDIDFDFVPRQPATSETAAPPLPRKMFRTRQHGTYKVLIGETETAPDGNVTINVPDLFSPDAPPQRYEKRQGEWQPVRPTVAPASRPELIREANRLLDDVEVHLAEAKAKEARNEYPGEIIRYLGEHADHCSDQATALENSPGAAEDPVMTSLSRRLRAAGAALIRGGHTVQVRMYKNRQVLDIMRLNFLLDNAELTATRTVVRKPLGKGSKKSFLDVYSLHDRAGQAPLWEAHFHYDNEHSPALNFRVKGGHLKTLEQSRLGLESQRRDAGAGRPHLGIWRETFDGKTARKIFDLAAATPASPR